MEDTDLASQSKHGHTIPIDIPDQLNTNPCQDMCSTGKFFSRFLHYHNIMNDCRMFNSLDNVLTHLKQEAEYTHYEKSFKEILFINLI